MQNTQRLFLLLLKGIESCMRITSDQRYRKKIKAAHLIYKERLPLQEVAQKLCVSRPTLTKFIDEILDEGIVSIQINDLNNYQQMVELGCSVAHKYNIRDAIIVEGETQDDIINNIGSAGANYLLDNLKNNLKIGISGGLTINALLTQLNPTSQFKNIQVVASSGGSLYADTNYHPSILAQYLAIILHGVSHYIYAPTYADNKAQYDMLIQNTQIKTSLDICRSVDIVLVGIGSKQNSIAYLPKPIAEELREKSLNGLSGGINALLLDKNGNPFKSPVSDLFIGLDYEALKKTKTVVALAGGSGKHTAIKAALEGGYVHVLITDKQTAEYLLA